MHQFMTSLMATISLETLIVYDFLCICRIINKEEIVKKFLEKYFSNIRYNETICFVVIRPIFLQVSFITYLLSIEVLSKISTFNIIMLFTPVLALVTGIINNRKK